MSKFTDEERYEKTIEIANYIIENNSSTRKAAEQFGISNATVSEWMNYLLKNLDYKKFLKVQEILIQNKPKTIEDIEVKKRVLKAAKLITQGYTVLEIANELGVSVNIINEDLQTRLPRISKDLHDKVRIVLKKNSMSNLKNVILEVEKGNENGKFTK